MFTKETYMRRRQELKKLVGNGVIILFGNNDAPVNYPANAYAPMRQDSSFLYYFGQHREGLVGVIDIDNDEEWLFGDDIDVEDIVWMGYTPSVADLAAEVGVKKTAPMAELKAICDKAGGSFSPEVWRSKGRTEQSFCPTACCLSRPRTPSEGYIQS